MKFLNLMTLGVSPNMILKYDDQLLMDFLREIISETDISNDQVNRLFTVFEKIIEIYDRLLFLKCRTKN